MVASYGSVAASGGYYVSCGADYITADAGSPSGWVLLNPIHTLFPGGYSPLFGGDIKDYGGHRKDIYELFAEQADRSTGF